jgi:ParB family chromosome partitioning protein
MADPLKIRATTVMDKQRTAAADIEHSAAGVAVAQARAAWEQRLPQDPKDLYAWLLTLPQTDLHSLLTLCVAASIDTIDSREAKDTRAEGLAAVLGLDMADWWQPTANGYLTHISKVQIVAAVSAAKSPEAAKQLPTKTKAELVAAAEIALRDTRWLPNVLKPALD